MAVRVPVTPRRSTDPITRRSVHEAPSPVAHVAVMLVLPIRVTGPELAIAGWIAPAHGGRLTLEDNRPGLRVRLTLPASG